MKHNLNVFVVTSLIALVCGQLQGLTPEQKNELNKLKQKLDFRHAEGIPPTQPMEWLKEKVPEVKEAKEGIKEVIEKAPEKEKTKMENIRQVGSIWEHRHDDLDWHPMSIPHSVVAVSDSEKTPSTPDEVEVTDTKEVTQDQEVEEERVREHNNIKEHKHNGYDYWHPILRIHKNEGDD